MKKFHRVVIIALTVMLCVLPLASISTFAADRGKSLIVYGGDSIGDGDKMVGDRLGTLGYPADYAFAPDTDESSWNGYDIVYIGESVSSADVGTKFTLAESLVIISEPGLMDEMQVGAYDPAYDSDAYTGNYIIKNDICASGLSTFKGFTSDDVVPGFLLEWADGAVIVCENEKGSPAVTYFAKGITLVDGSTAVGPRIQWFFRGQFAAVATDETWQLWDAMINYVFPLPVVEEIVEETPAESASADGSSGEAPAAAVTATAPQTGDILMVSGALAIVSAGLALFIAQKKKR